jgi:hypothetical protein
MEPHHHVRITTVIDNNLLNMSVVEHQPTKTYLYFTTCRCLHIYQTVRSTFRAIQRYVTSSLPLHKCLQTADSTWTSLITSTAFSSSTSPTDLHLQIRGMIVLHGTWHLHCRPQHQEIVVFLSVHQFSDNKETLYVCKFEAHPPPPSALPFYWFPTPYIWILYLT